MMTLFPYFQNYFHFVCFSSFIAKLVPPTPSSNVLEMFYFFSGWHAHVSSFYGNSASSKLCVKSPIKLFLLAKENSVMVKKNEHAKKIHTAFNFLL